MANFSVTPPPTDGANQSDVKEQASVEKAPDRVLQLASGDKLKLTGFQFLGSTMRVDQLSQERFNELADQIRKILSSLGKLGDLKELRVIIDPKQHDKILIELVSNSDTGIGLGLVSESEVKRAEAESKVRVETRPIQSQRKDWEKVADVCLDMFLDSPKIDDEYMKLTGRLDAEARRLALEEPVFEKVFEDDSHTYGKERMVRESVIHQAYATVKQSLAYWQGQPASDVSAKAIAHFKAMEANIIAYHKLDGKDWLDCNYWRFLIRDCNDYNKAVEAYIAAPINMRCQSFYHDAAANPDVDRPDVRFMRLGVISDRRNGFFSIKFLKEIHDLPLDKREPIIRDKVKHVLKNCKKFSTEIEGIGHDVQEKDESLWVDPTIQAAMEGNLKALEPAIERFEKTIEFLSRQTGYEAKLRKCRLQSALQALIKLNTFLTDKSHITAQIESRQRILQDKMLQLVAAQIANNASEVRPGQPIRIANLSLLRAEDKPKMDETGWMADEGVDVEDMSTIFQIFNNKNVIFEDSGSAPFLDKDGNIHIPRPQRMAREVQNTKIETFFFNVCPQGNKVSAGFANVPYQQEINQENLRAIAAVKGQLQENAKAQGKEKEFLDAYQELRNQLSYTALDYLTLTSWGTYERAEKVGTLLCKLGLFLSVNCASSKDRTGVESSRIVLSFQTEAHFKGQPNPFSPKIFEEGYGLVRNIQENTSIPYVKADPRGIPDVGYKIKPLLNFKKAKSFRSVAQKAWASNYYQLAEKGQLKNIYSVLDSVRLLLPPAA